MKLKPLDNYLNFMTAVRECAGDVLFTTEEGDRLDLRSVFCQYLFASSCTDRDFLAGGRIQCSETADYDRLAPYLTE